VRRIAADSTAIRVRRIAAATRPRVCHSSVVVAGADALTLAAARRRGKPRRRHSGCTELQSDGWS